MDLYILEIFFNKKVVETALCELAWLLEQRVILISASTSETYVLIYSLINLFHYVFLNCHVCTYNMIMSVTPTNYHFYE